MEQSTSPTYQPRGWGGTAGHVFRMIVCVLTSGFVFPHTFVEGMDLTAIQKKTAGALYDKDKKASESEPRF